MMTDYVQSDTYRAESTCKLFADDHMIAEPIADVLERIDRAGDIGVAATGCPSCGTIEEPARVTYVAQRDGAREESVYLNYAVDEGFPLSDELLGAIVVKAAELEEVPVYWDGDDSTAILVGEDAREHEDDADDEGGDDR